MNIYDDSSEKRSWFITTQHIRHVLRSNGQSLIIRGNSFSTYHTFWEHPIFGDDMEQVLNIPHHIVRYCLKTNATYYLLKDTPSSNWPHTYVIKYWLKIITQIPSMWYTSDTNGLGKCILSIQSRYLHIDWTAYHLSQTSNTTIAQRLVQDMRTWIIALYRYINGLRSMFGCLIIWIEKVDTSLLSNM